MAGGKETPRQKLVGLMYLVLLALLALQVSSDIMNKFLQINDSLTGFVKESKIKSGDVINNISDKVTERGNKPGEVKALKEAKELHAKSEELLTWITDLKNEIIIATGGTDQGETSLEGTPIGLKDGDKTSTILLGQGDRKDGAAYELKTRLDAHIKYLNQVAVSVAKAIDSENPKATKFGPLALDGKDDPLFAKVEGSKTKDFAHLNFDHTPMVASMAFLTEKQAKVAAYEAQILEQMKGLVGAADFKFDVVLPMVKANSNTVVAGRAYEAEMFVSATSSTLQPKMKASKGSLKMEGAVGKVKFTAGASSYKDGLSEQSWSGEITIPKPTGGDTTLKLVTKYYVAQPVLKVSAGDIAALYLNCANPLSVSCPALGAEFAPSYKASGGSVRKGKKTGDIVVFPTGKQVVLSVSSGGQPVGKESFKVKKIPLPTIEVRPNGRKMTAAQERTGLSAPPRSISVVALPDAGFKSALPSEAKYYVTKWTATLVRGKRPVGGSMTITKTKGDISRLRSKAKTGDRILVEVKNVIRKNSLGKSEGVKVGLVVKNITF